MSRRSGKTVTSLFVRNVRHDARQEDIRKQFSKYGDISDVYIPLDHYSREPRGFAYVQYDYREDAEDALYYLDGTSFMGRVMQIHYAQSDRKTPGQMRHTGGFRGGRGGGGGGGSHRRRRSFSRSRSRSPRRRRTSRRSNSRSQSRSRSPPPRRRSRSQTRSQSPVRRSRRDKSRSRSPVNVSRSRSVSRSPR